MVMFLEMDFFSRFALKIFYVFFCQKTVRLGFALGKWVWGTYFTLLYTKPNKYEINFE